MTHTDLIARLRGEYRIPIMDGLGPAGGEEPDNPTEFVRRFEAPPIQHEAASALTVAQERIEALEEALRPFAKSGELFPEEPGTVEFDICVYRPAKGREWGLCGDDLRRARAALAGKGEA